MSVKDVYGQPVSAEEAAALKEPVRSGVSEEAHTVLLQAEARQRAFDERRFAIVSLTLPGVVTMLGNGARDYFTFDGLPSDMQFVAAHLDPYLPDRLWVQVATMEFAPVLDGERAPDVLIQTLTWSKEEIVNG